jgi:hypothetical protein
MKFLPNAEVKQYQYDDKLEISERKEMGFFFRLVLQKLFFSV